MNISEEQIEQTRNNLNLITAEIDLHEKELEAWQELGKTEINFWAWLAMFSVPESRSRKPLDFAIEANQRHNQAASALKIIHLAKMKADQKVMQELLAEVDRVRAGSGGKKLIHTAN